MKIEDDKMMQSRLQAVLREADAELPKAIGSRLTAARQQAMRDARLAATRDHRRKRWQLLGWTGAAAAGAAALLALLWLPQTPPPGAGLPLAALPSERVAADMPLLLDADFALLADADTALEADDALAFYAWLAQADAQLEPAADVGNELDVKI